jgi:Sec-independent protein translocase protein TatA
MNATSIVLLIGVCSFWVVVGVVFALFGRTRKVLESMGETLSEIRNDLARLTPVVSNTLQEVERTGHEVGQTASEIKVLTRKINSGNTASAVSGAVNYVPVVITLLKAAKPFFDRVRNRK